MLEPVDHRRLANLCGQFDEHLRQIERRLGVEINNRGNAFRVIGESHSVQAAGEVLKDLYTETAHEALSPQRIHLYLQESGVEARLDEPAESVETVVIQTRQGAVTGRGPNQQL